MIKRFVGCGGWETEGKGRVCVWGEYCVSEEKGEREREAKESSEADGGSQ